jgi:hypothetical protein
VWWLVVAYRTVVLELTKSRGRLICQCHLLLICVLHVQYVWAQEGGLKDSRRGVGLASGRWDRPPTEGTV